MKLMTRILFFAFGFLFSLNALAVDKPLLLATEATYPPFESVNSKGEIIGFDIDVLKAICQKIHRTCQFINRPWDNLIPGLQLDKFDVIFGAMNITAERQQQVNFTKPYYVDSGTLIAAKSAKLALNSDALKNKTIGVQGSTTYEQYLQAVYGKVVRTKRYASYQEAFFDLQSGRIDAVLGDTPIMKDWIKNPAVSATYTAVGGPITDEKFFNQGYGFAVKKSNITLLNELDSGLAAIKSDGSLQKIEQQYFGKNG